MKNVVSSLPSGKKEKSSYNYFKRAEDGRFIFEEVEDEEEQRDRRKRKRQEEQNEDIIEQEQRELDKLIMAKGEKTSKEEYLAKRILHFISFDFVKLFGCSDGSK
jgi:hypothetical protein